MPLNPALVDLRCFACDAAHDPGRLQTLCEACHQPLRADYDLAAARSSGVVDPGVASMWRYAAVLPVPAGEAVSLGEGWTPLLPAGDGVWVKDEAQNPTGSFKARGMSAAVSAARALGASALAVPSAGNAGGALAAYGAGAGIPVVVALPSDTPPAFVEECRHYGAEVHLVDGTIAQAGAWLRAHRPAGAFDLSTLREPYRVEGKKTLAYELFEQRGRRLPDVVVCPTGGGTALVGIWKAMAEMAALGWLGDAAEAGGASGAPVRLVCVQAEGCAPIVRAFAAGATSVEPWRDPRTEAWGLRVPSPVGGAVCLRALRETGGTAVAVAEDDIGPAARDLACRTGIDVCPEAGAAWAALRRLRAGGWIGAGDEVVVLNTGTGLKYRG